MILGSDLIELTINCKCNELKAQSEITFDFGVMAAATSFMFDGREEGGEQERI